MLPQELDCALNAPRLFAPPERALHVLIPLAPGPDAEAALRRVSPWGYTIGGCVTLLRVVREPAASPLGLEALGRLHDVLRQDVNDPSAYLPNHGKGRERSADRTAVATAGVANAGEHPVAPKVATVTRSGRPADEIVKYALESRVDLIVLGAACASWARRKRLGRVAHEVILRAACPVFLL